MKILHVCLTAGCAGIAGWLLLRQPELRNFLIELVPHRIRIEATFNRELLAPRSVFFAGALVFLATALLVALPRARRQILAPITKTSAATALFVLVQCMIAAAVVINLNLWVHRQFGSPIGTVQTSAIMKYTLPHVWDEVHCLRQNAPPNACVALISNDEFNTNLLGPLAYPIAMYDFRFGTGSIDEEAARMGITHIAEYRTPGIIYDRVSRPGGIPCYNLHLRPLE